MAGLGIGAPRRRKGKQPAAPGSERGGKGGEGGVEEDGFTGGLFAGAGGGAEERFDGRDGGGDDDDVFLDAVVRVLLGFGDFGK